MCKYSISRKHHQDQQMTRCSAHCITSRWQCVGSSSPTFGDMNQFYTSTADFRNATNIFAFQSVVLDYNTCTLMEPSPAVRGLLAYHQNDQRPDSTHFQTTLRQSFCYIRARNSQPQPKTTDHVDSNPRQTALHTLVPALRRHLNSRQRAPMRRGNRRPRDRSPRICPLRPSRERERSIRRHRIRPRIWPGTFIL